MKSMFGSTLAFLLLFALLAAPAHAGAPAVSGDVRLVLDVAKGEADAARRDDLLRYGARYAKSAADAKALVSALSPAAQKALSAWPEKCPSCKGTGKDALGKPCFQCHGAGWTGPMRAVDNPFLCDMCRGTGELFPGKLCPKCHGSGMSGPMKAVDKGAAAKVMQPVCDVCYGSGQGPTGEPCWACGGGGWPPPPAKAAPKCATKSGDAAKVSPGWCDMCRGTGELYPGQTCPACHGSGWPMMKALDPNPVVCPSCKGTGKTALGKPCFQCHGAGMTGPMRIWQENPFQCGMCQGTGELFPGKVCPACHGAGVPGPMRGLKPAVFDRTLERILKVRVASKNDPRDKRILDEMLRLREENRR